jgi:hypothetical protein
MQDLQTASCEQLRARVREQPIYSRVTVAAESPCNPKASVQ